MVNPFERFGQPFTKFLSPFERFGKPFAKFLSPFEWFAQPFAKFLSPFERLVYRSIKKPTAVRTAWSTVRKQKVRNPFKLPLTCSVYNYLSVRSSSVLNKKRDYKQTTGQKILFKSPNRCNQMKETSQEVQ